MTDQASPVARPWRRFLRFSVRGMIALVLLVAGWLGWIVHSARIQREAVAAIQSGGGNVAYDWQWKNSSPVQGAKPWGPRWLMDMFGVDYFGHVIFVVTPGTSDGVLLQVEQLAQVQDLVILNPEKITDASLIHLKGLTRLRALVLGGAQVTDAGINHLKGLTDLEILDLGSTQVTDAGLSHFEGLTKLSLLSLMDTQVTDAGLAHLKGLTNLTELTLLHTNVTDAGLAQLKGLTKLTVLDVEDTSVTNAGAEKLKHALPNLKITR
jgi:internalin A